MMKKKTKLTALCGILSALSVVIMLPTLVIPVLTYVAPMIAGFVIMTVSDIAGKKWAFGVFSAVSVITLIILTDKEASLTYIAFFGYYPLIRENLEKKRKVLSLIFKFLLFNISMVTVSLLGIYVFAVPVEDFTSFGRFSVPILLFLANIVFILYDFSFKRLNPLIKAVSQKLMKI